MSTPREVHHVHRLFFQVAVKFGDPELGCVCDCCARNAASSGSCASCRFAVGWHRCQARPDDLLWCAGTLHGGKLDIQRVLFNLHRRQLPMDAIDQKANDYVTDGLVTREEADGMLLVIRAERGVGGIANEVCGNESDPAPSCAPRRLSKNELQALLDKRVGQMQDGGSDDSPTDQYRVYKHIIEQLDSGTPLRLMAQASAGTGKSHQGPPYRFFFFMCCVHFVFPTFSRIGGRGFLLNTVYLHCILQKKHVRVCAPTGIAAANIEVEGSAVSATTLHCLFDFDAEYESRLDFNKTTNEKVDALLCLDVLYILQ